MAAASPALASGPEQIEQLEPEGGEWQAEISLLASRGAAAMPSFQLLRGLSDRVALGIEVEGEGGKIDSFAPTILYRFGDAANGVGVGVIGQIEFATNFVPSAAEARVVVEHKTPNWWPQANAILQVEREGGQSATALGYSWRISRSVSKALWLGAEGSGHLARSSRSSADRGQFLGPALTFAHNLRSGAEIEVNASYLRRAAGEGPRDALQVSLQIGL